MRRFKHWAHLNDEGMDLFGKVFPDKTVPVLSMIWKTGSVGNPENIEDYFTVQWDELTEGQRYLMLEILSNKFDVKKSDIKGQIEDIGLPLRRSLTKGSGTNHPGLFI